MGADSLLAADVSGWFSLMKKVLVVAQLLLWWFWVSCGVSLAGVSPCCREGLRCPPCSLKALEISALAAECASCASFHLSFWCSSLEKTQQRWQSWHGALFFSYRRSRLRTKPWPRCCSMVFRKSVRFPPSPLQRGQHEDTTHLSAMCF